jgi:hypothetical protein
MAGKVVKSSFVLLRKIILNRKESSSKSATSHIRKTLPKMPQAAGETGLL